MSTGWDTGISPAGVTLTEEEKGIICQRHRVNVGAVVTRDGEVLGATWPEGQYAREVMEYVTAVACGEIVAGADRMLGCVRFLRFLARGDLDVNTHAADFVITIIERTFRHRQGEALDGTPLRGTPLKLEAWQKYVIYGIMIFYKRGTVERLTKEAFIFVPRKNGKTIMVAALAWALSILSRKSGAKCYVVGAALKQALETFDDWEYVLENSLYDGRKGAEKHDKKGMLYYLDGSSQTPYLLQSGMITTREIRSVVSAVMDNFEEPEEEKGPTIWDKLFSR